MKSFTILFLLPALILSCNTDESEQSQKTDQDSPVRKIEKEAFQQLIDSSGVTGAVLIFDPQQNIYYSNDFARCDRGFLPASTFKIPNSIIALETGVVENDSTLFQWDGKKRRLSIWERDMVFREAFHLSCVPCYQEIARKVGVPRMNEYLNRFDYGNMQVDTANIDRFWLEGNSRITPNQQIGFLRRFYDAELPIAPRTERIMKSLMVMEETNGYKLSGKTGWAIRDGFNIGWFVGYLEIRENVYFIAVNIDPKEDFNMDFFARVRKDIALKALEHII